MFLIKFQTKSGYTMYAAKSYSVSFDDSTAIVSFDHASDNEPHAAATINLTVSGDDLVWVMNQDGRTVDRFSAPNRENSRIGYSR